MDREVAAFHVGNSHTCTVLMSTRLAFYLFSLYNGAVYEGRKTFVFDFVVF